MMPVIRVSNEVVNILKKYAVPLEDSHDSVLRRILSEYDMLTSSSGGNSHFGVGKGKPLISSKHSISSGLHVKRETKWIIEALNSLGGKGSANGVINLIERNHSKYFLSEDLETLSSGEIRWKRKVNATRYRMVQEGLLTKDSPRGIWELTAKRENITHNSRINGEEKG